MNMLVLLQCFRNNDAALCALFVSLSATRDVDELCCRPMTTLSVSLAPPTWRLLMRLIDLRPGPERASFTCKRHVNKLHASFTARPSRDANSTTQSWHWKPAVCHVPHYNTWWMSTAEIGCLTSNAPMLHPLNETNKQITPRWWQQWRINIKLLLLLLLLFIISTSHYTFENSCYLFNWSSNCKKKLNNEKKLKWWQKTEMMTDREHNCYTLCFKMHGLRMTSIPSLTNSEFLNPMSNKKTWFLISTLSHHTYSRCNCPKR